MLDVDQARQETPGCARFAHLNNAGTALPTRAVTQAVIDHLELEAAIGGYEAQGQAAAAVAHVYDAGAAVLGCHPDELAFTDSATRAWTTAFNALNLGPGDQVLTSRAEYISNAFAYITAVNRRGVEIVVAPDDEHGQVDVGALADRVTDRTKLIALTHIPTGSGLVNPAAAVGAVAKEAGVLYLLDACQSVGQIPVDVHAIGCDLLSFTGRKFVRGPRGTAMLYVRRALIDELAPPAALDGSGASWIAPFTYEMSPTARRFEPFESSVAAKIGLGVALDDISRWGIDNISHRVMSLAHRLRADLEDRPGVTVHDKGQVRSGIVTFSVEGHDPAELVEQLRSQQVNTWVTDAGSSQLDFPERGLDRLVRASVHYYNNDADLDRLLVGLP